MLRLYDVRGGSLKEIALEDLNTIPNGAFLSIDGSSTCTGMTLLTDRGAPLVTMMLKPDVKGELIRFKLNMKMTIESIIMRDPWLQKIFYEEPTLEYANNIKALYALRTVVPEILIEHEDFFKGRIEFIEVNNQRWKKIFLSPTPVPKGSDAQKEKVREKAESIFEWTKDKRITQDEIDSLGMGIACGGRIFTGQGDSLTSKNRVKTFKYNIHLIGADSDLEAVSEMLDEASSWKPKIPAKFSGATLEITELSGRGIFEKRIYETMGDQDKLIVLKFKSTQYQNVLMEHDFSKATSVYNYVYAFIWRVSRKGGTTDNAKQKM